MPEPLRYDMILPNGEPLRWDMGPEYTWGGNVPASAYPTPPNTMSQNLIDLDISDADWTAIDAALTVLETKLGAKLLDLTTAQRGSLNKMGEKSEAFCRQSLVVGRQNVGELTARAATALTAAEGDLANVDKLRPRLARLTALTEKTDDSEMALGSDVMEFSLFLYGLLAAVGAGAGLDALYAQLGVRFARSSTPETPPPTP